MKLPEVGPDIRSVMIKRKRFNEIALSDEINDIIMLANNEYWPWEKFKYKAKHIKFTPEELWVFLKMSRLRSRKKLPIYDIQNTQFSYWLPDNTLEELHYIDKSIGGTFLLQEDASLPPEAKRRYVISTLMEEAIASSQIEGAVTTRRIAKEMLRKKLRPRNRSEQMIINNYNTISIIKDKINEPMSIELLNHIHRLITDGTLDDPDCSGRFRKRSEPIQVMDEEGQILHTPPPAGHLKRLAGKMCDFANDKDQGRFIHPAIRAIVLHFWLAYLHPYVDGNGRTARALFYWYMLRHGYWLFEYLSISRIILRSRLRYQRTFLHVERDGLDLTYFIVYHLRAIRLAFKELQHYISRRQKEYREILSILRKASWMNYRQQALVQHALKNPEFIYTVQSHKNSHNVTPQTARVDLLELVERGFLESSSIGRRFQFTVPSNLSIKIAQLDSSGNL